MENVIITELNNSYTGEDGITLTQALARIAAQFYDPQNRQTQEGNWEEVNMQSWSQRLALQAVANMAWRQMHDTNLDRNKKPKGVAHKLDNARRYANQLGKVASDQELDIEAMNNAADWIERLEAEYSALEELFHAAAAVYEAAVGEDFKPYEPWTTDKKRTAKVDSGAARDVMDRLARLGVTVDVAPELNTNGVDTNEANVA